MSNYDQELITDLISGRLPPQERQAALARLAQDPELRSEYEAQLAVSSLLADAPASVMTADERSALRASLVQQLHLDDAPAAVSAAPARWQRWWAPVAGLAAAAARIVGAGDTRPGVASDDSMDVASADVTTTIAASQSDGGGGESEEPDVLAFSDESEETTETAETPTTAAAALETTTTSASAAEDLVSAAGDASPRSLPYVPNLDLEDLAQEYAAGPQELDDALAKSASEEGRLDTAAAYECFEASDSAPTEGATVEVVASGTLDGTEVAVLVVTPSGAEPYLVALDMNSCSVVSSVRP
jgi:hypothetical protein